MPIWPLLSSLLLVDYGGVAVLAMFAVVAGIGALVAWCR
jgi:hypothetical protein